MLPLESTLANERYLSKKLCAVILLLGCVLDRGEISENSKRKINRCSSHVCTGYDDFFNTSRAGLTEEQVEENRDIYGENELTKGQEDSIFKKIYESIINPFTVILLLIALVSLVTTFGWQSQGKKTRRHLSSSLSLSCCLVVFALCKNCGATKQPAIFHV